MKVKYIYILLCLVMLNSCNDEFLDVAPKDQLSSESFFKTSDDAIQAANGVYNTLNDNFEIYFTLMDGWSDNSTPVFIPGDPRRIASGLHTASTSDIRNWWGTFYRHIRRTNVFLTNIDNVEDIEEGLQARLKAEISFLRVYWYYHLVYNWGDVPFITDVVTVEEAKIGRTAKSEIVDFMIRELDNAIPDLPSSYSGGDVGRVTSGAAQALKARILLYESRWGEAASAAQQVISSGSYDLFPNYEQAFSRENKNNEEVIFDVQFIAEDYTNLRNILFQPPSFSGWGALSPVQSFVDSFEGTDGLPIDDPASIYDPSNPFDNRDPRLDMALNRNGSQWRGATLNTIDGNPDGIAVTGNSTRSGYYVRKGLDIDHSGAPGTSYGNYILLRYAEMLLTYAEAKIEESSIDQSVLDALNDVRARAYGTTREDIANYPEITTMNQAELREIVRRERRVELCFEGLNVFDMRRWRTAEVTMNGAIFNARGEEIEPRIFDPNRDYLWPIPQAEIDAIGSDVLLQNPNY
ncbi:RagB/SusD family nutrient uptake outer membrane protein [Fulvivirgaceae bacterium BMA10]|uniref:RagB/SusD family nutrient uptake outer membrane protein n=1 Tax=Splendidivirga corallicola TaxID=3051826 RepID=A0ABT8KI48_9BACT|nr:RagB/SusD family nutrient uptake outer membrane protein [Fulvivirgaceae bacterium BMA10]